MKNRNQLFIGTLKNTFIFMLLIVMSGCTLMLDGKNESQSKIDFGVIESFEIAFPSMISQYDLIGGYVGLLDSASLASKDSEVVSHLRLDTRRYKIREQNGQVVTYVTDKSFFVEGDCVAVEQGNTLNLRLIDDSICQGNTPDTLAKTKMEQAAELCALDKRQLIIAQDEEQVHAANDRIHRDCQYQH